MRKTIRPHVLSKHPECSLLLLALAFTLAASNARAQTINMPTLTNVGSGLQGTAVTASLSTSQHGGTTVHIESDNPSVVLVAPNISTAGATSFDVFVPNGSTGVNLVISGVEGTTGTATITVSAPGFTSGTRTATIVQPALDVIGLSTTIDTLDPADPFQVRVGLPAAGNGSVSTAQNVRVGGTALTATVVNFNATAGELITTAVTGQTVTVSIAPGTSLSGGSVASGGVAFDGLDVVFTVVSATIPGFIATTNASVTVSVTQPAISLGAIPNVGAGLQGNTNSVGLSASQHGGVTVHVESADPSVALVSPNGSTAGTASIDIFLANGFTGTGFVVSGLEGASGSSLITVSAPGFTGVSHTVTIQQAALDISQLSTPIDTLDPADPFQVRIGLPNGGNTSVNPTQVIRAGGVALVATIALSAPAIADLITTPVTADTITVTIPVGASFSGSTVSVGGVAFDGIALGTTTVSATIPGLIATTNANVSVTVTQPTLAMNAIGNTGSGLTSTANTVTLGASQHGGVTVHIESLNPSVALIAPNAATVGSVSLDIFIANGITSTSFNVSGLEGVTGSSTISASAPGFVGTSRTATVVQPAMTLSSLGTTLDTLAPADPFQVSVGVQSGGVVNPPQTIRAGGASLVATIKNSNHPVGELITTALTGDSVIVSIAVGSATSPATVAAGGVSFDGTASGSTTVSATIPGFIAVAAASQNVNVTAPSIAMNGLGNIGAGLQGSANSATLSVSTHGGVTVHIASSNPSVALVSPNASTAGIAAIDVVVPNLSSQATFHVQGVENTTGTSNISASAPGFSGATQLVTIVQPAVDISQLASTFDASDANDPFVMRVGLPSGGNATVSPVQSVRAGSSGLSATVILSNGEAGQLVTTAASNDTVTVSIPSGASSSGATVALGGVAFDPLAVGTTLVSAAIPGFIITGAATQQLAVSARIVTLSGINDVGAGLQIGPINATLGLGQHGGVTVHVASSDPTVVLVAPDFTTPGSASLDFPLSNGSTQVSFFVQGIATGISMVTASVPTFTPASHPANVVQPALQVTLLADTLLDNDFNDPFVVQVGIPTGDNGAVGIAQPVRAGGEALTATLTCSDVSVAPLVTGSETGSPVTVSIAVGELKSAASASLGGVELDPENPGSVTVSATIPGYIATTAASKSVVVKPHVQPTGVGPLPRTYALGQNIPNPFNPVTTISYDVPVGGAGVNISIYDVSGRLVRDLVHEHRLAGTFSVQWNGDDDRGQRVASGVYFYRMRAGEFVETRKLLLLK